MAFADEPGAWITLAGVALLVYLMWTLARKARPVAETPAPAAAPADEAHEGLLLRFVTDEQGNRLGETVAVDGDRVVLKVKDGFVAVPADKIKAAGSSLQLDYGVDWTEAKQVGEAWRERAHKVITYSESELPKDES